MEKTKDKKIELKNTREIELPKLDVKQYIGRKVPIIAVEEYEGEYGFYIKVIADKVAEYEKDGEAIELRPSMIFGLHTDDDGVVGWGKETKLGVFLERMKVKHYKELPGKMVIVQTTSNKKGNEFLSF